MIFRYGGWLIAFNLLFAILVWLTMYFPGLDLLASLAFVFILVWFSRCLGRMNFIPEEISKENDISDHLLTAEKSDCQRSLSIIAISIIGQSPGLVAEGLAIWNWIHFGPFTSNYDFVLQMWHTPWVPFLSLLPSWTLEGFAVSFLSLYLLSPVIILFMVILAFACQTRKGL